MYLCMLIYWLLATAEAASIPPRQPNSLLQEWVNSLKNLVPSSLGGLSPVLGVSKKYEYVVVGAGTAGTTLAVRLAQSGAKVALVEAGTF